MKMVLVYQVKLAKQTIVPEDQTYEKVKPPGTMAQ